MRYLFFTRPMLPFGPAAALPDRCTLEEWRPSLGRARPPDLPVVPFLVWGLFHFLGIFASGDYTLFLVRRDGVLVHRTCIFPRHYKFPFMAAGDLQAAAIWTAPELRGCGLGRTVLQEVLQRLADPARTLWYLVRDDNHPSIRLAEKCGFRLLGQGGLRSRLGLHQLGIFRMD